jgi:hypothetical protein
MISLYAEFERNGRTIKATGEKPPGGLTLVSHDLALSKKAELALVTQAQTILVKEEKTRPLSSVTDDYEAWGPQYLSDFNRR